MTIDKFKIDGGTITVDYSGLFETFRIGTGDEARTELYQAAANVAILGRLALGMEMECAGFVAIEFSRGDKPSTKLALSMPTLTGDPAKISCPKIMSYPVKDHETGELIEGHPQNIYNAAVAALEAEIVTFVKGKRLQMALPFDQMPEERKLQEDVREFVASGAKMLEFESAASSAP